MKPKINSTRFGSITVKSKISEHDIVLRKNGQTKKRRKKLSEKIYGTSHKISLAEAKYIYDKGADELIIDKFFEESYCKTKLLPTPKAIKLWNRSKGKVIAMFHVTC